MRSGIPNSDLPGSPATSLRIVLPVLVIEGRPALSKGIPGIRPRGFPVAARSLMSRLYRQADISHRSNMTLFCEALQKTELINDKLHEELREKETIVRPTRARRRRLSVVAKMLKRMKRESRRVEQMGSNGDMSRATFVLLPQLYCEHTFCGKTKGKYQITSESCDIRSGASEYMQTIGWPPLRAEEPFSPLNREKSFCAVPPKGSDPTLVQSPHLSRQNARRRARTLRLVRPFDEDPNDIDSRFVSELNRDVASNILRVYGVKRPLV